MKIAVDKLEPNTGQVEGVPKNPRFIKDDNYKKLKQSIIDDPKFMELHKILVLDMGDDRYVIMGGNMRYRAIKELGWKEVDASVMEKNTPVELIRSRIIKHNSNYGDYDIDLIANEWSDYPLQDWGSFIDKDFNMVDDFYSKEIKAPIYEPVNERPQIELLVNTEKADKLLQDIKNANISDEDKKFLTISAYRHFVFNYSKIADYYAHSDKEVQELMEKSALVIIDYKKAIEYGYVELVNNIMTTQEQDYD